MNIVHKQYPVSVLQIALDSVEYRPLKAGLLIVLLGFCLGLPAASFGAVELEPNDDVTTANTLGNGKSITGQLSSQTDADWFRVVGDLPDEVSVAFKCNQGAYYYSYYNPYYYTVSAYNSSGGLLSSYLVPLSSCSNSFDNPFVMHLNGTANGVASIKVSVKVDTNDCYWCYYSDLSGYTSEYALLVSPPNTVAVAPTTDIKLGKIVRGSRIHKDLRQHADKVNIKLRGCKDEDVPTTISISGNHLKLAEITRQTHVALEIGNWRCDADGSWGSSLYEQGDLYKVRGPK